MTPPAAALATALVAVTGQDWRWMECADGVQYASVTLPSGVVVVVMAPPHARPEAVAVQARAAVAPTGA